MYISDSCFLKRLLIATIFLPIVFSPLSLVAQLGIWTSAAELADKPMSGPAWAAVKNAADVADPNGATVSDQNSNNNAEILAAGIVYARTGDEIYKNKVISACEKLADNGKPGANTLAWARETGAYVLAADLVGYRSQKFEQWLQNMVEVYVGTDNRTLLFMYKRRPNNWGTQAFGSLCAIYVFLQNTTRIQEIRDYWIQSVIGPQPVELTYGSDISWHLDPNNLRLINPKNSIKQGLNIDGIIPDDMRRGTSFKNPPDHTGYAWETLQGIVMGARILDRLDMPIWSVADSAIFRAFNAIQVRWENQYGGWKAEGDDLWMLPFMDYVYGTNWTEGQPERVWKHGKNTGWPYVVWTGPVKVNNPEKKSNPETFELYQNYPNPFSAKGGSATGGNPTTTISYFLPEKSTVVLKIFNVLGEKLITLVNEEKNDGIYYVEWDAIDKNGIPVPNGVYLYHINTGSHDEVNKMILIR